MVTVPVGINSVSVNFTILRDDMRSWAIDHDFGITDNVIPMNRYLNHSEILQQLQNLENTQPSVAESVPLMNISSLIITEKVCIIILRPCILGISIKELRVVQLH